MFVAFVLRVCSAHSVRTVAKGLNGIDWVEGFLRVLGRLYPATAMVFLRLGNLCQGFMLGFRRG